MVLGVVEWGVPVVIIKIQHFSIHQQSSFHNLSWRDHKESQSLLRKLIYL